MQIQSSQNFYGAGTYRTLNINGATAVIILNIAHIAINIICFFPRALL